MGLHTGEGILGGDNYLGLDVNRAARIAAAAHGGQVLLSDATRALVARSLPPGITLRDLGNHRLKDLMHPERLHQVVIEGLEQSFPPPRSLDARPHNLPAQLTRFIGRDNDIARIGELLADDRLVTLTGPGGTGKTRLGLQVAAEALAGFRDGVYFVDLSAVTDSELVPEEMAAALRLRAEPGRAVLDTLGVICVTQSSCSCWTTSSKSWTPARASWNLCYELPPALRPSRPAAFPCTCTESVSTRSLRSGFRTRIASPNWRHSCRTRPSAFSSSGPSR